MEKQTFSGRTLSDALDEAARTLGTEKSLVSYNVVNAAKEGGLFAKLFSRGVKIEAWVDTNQDDLEAAAREAVRAGLRQNQPQRNGGAQAKPGAPNAGKGHAGERRPNDEKKKDLGRDVHSPSLSRREGSPRTGQPQQVRSDLKNRSEREHRPERERRPERNESTASEKRAPHLGARSAQASGHEPEAKGLDLDAPGVMDTLKEFTATFLKSYAIDPALAKYVRQDPGDVVVQVDDKHLEDLLGQTDKLSHAFEHVFKRIAQKRHGDVAARISLNAGAAQDIRAERLREMALSLAAQVKGNGKTVTLGAKSPQERRVIHLTLDGMEGVGTRSVGTGDSRKLVIFSTLKEHQAQGRGDGRQSGRNAGGNRGGGARQEGQGRRGSALHQPRGGNKGSAPAQKGHPIEAGSSLTRTGGDAGGPAHAEPREDSREPSRQGRRRRGKRNRGPRDGQAPKDGQRDGRAAAPGPHVDAKG
jgi:spoIIIJ-associated protein